MPGVLTTASNVTCGHAGSVSTSSSTKLQVNGTAVLLQSGIVGQSIAGCITPNSSNPPSQLCKTVSSVTAGSATKLQANGQPVILDTLAGTTDGVVPNAQPNLLAGTAGQTKLTAS
ncbi:hypothetical protein [Burkholderia pyrrocinia]|uniref:hypothetical protein n=1 Tax=Burkholderia pyrrocinia TaxID=60550 RepID=UPI001BD0EC07|nr:hypothetical protein [Burkholderia pyrrocinia]QVN21767.1 hypothetical protein JYG32_20505 [Burkholderia pyrrocinia]